MRRKKSGLELYLFSLLLGMVAMGSFAWSVKDYDVIWNSPSEAMQGSMPIGNGDIGANLWFDKNDLVFYVSKMDCWDDNGRLAKVGKVRISFAPNPFAGGKDFLQKLDLGNGQILIRTGGENPTSMKFWIDANHPVIQVESKSEKPVTVQARIELWRTKQYERPVQCGSPFGDDPQGRKHLVEPDVILNSLPNEQIGWYHRNIKSIGPKMSMEYQGLQDYPGFKDILLYRTCGAVITGVNAKRLNDKVLQENGKENRFSIYVVTEQPATEKEWLGSIRSAMIQTEEKSFSDRYQEHRAWWKCFWDRSWISIQGNSPEIVPFLPSNCYAFRIGADQKHNDIFGGKFGRFSFIDHACTPAEMAEFSSIGPDTQRLSANGILSSGIGKIDADVPDSIDWGKNQDLTFEAWIQPRSQGGETGRILDKLTPGVQDGFLLDTYPGNCLRLLVGKRLFVADNCLRAGQWSHVGVILSGKENRLELYLDGKKIGSLSSGKVTDSAFIVARAYNLQRFMNACAGRGKFPIKFNGSIFNVDYQGDPDDRRWGQGYWWQNSRLPYTTMTLSGDFDLMKPLFHMYGDVIYPLCLYRTKSYFGYGGNAAYFPEVMNPWGANTSETYGWGKPRSQRKDPLQGSRWHKWEWLCGPEFVFMMMDYCDFTDDYSMMKTKVIPIAESLMAFFENFYKRDAQGKLFMKPSQSTETWRDCTNPMTEIAALRAITSRLLLSDKKYSTEQQRKRWSEFLNILPDFPTRKTPGGIALAPADQYANKMNYENPELYSVFPFRQFGIGKPHLDWARNALKYRWDKGAFSWRQDSIFMAYLGVEDQARDYLVERAKNYLGNYRFPVYWINPWNSAPCQDHGSILLRTAQAMLLQNDPYSDQIYLLPAWPKEWNVEFKLCAPHRTTVEGKVKAGRLIDLKVTPEARRKDIFLCGGFASDVQGLAVLPEQ